MNVCAMVQAVGRLEVIGDTRCVCVCVYVCIYVWVYIFVGTYEYVSLFVYAIAMLSCGTVGCNRRQEMDNWSNSWGQTYSDLSHSNHHHHY